MQHKQAADCKGNIYTSLYKKIVIKDSQNQAKNTWDGATNIIVRHCKCPMELFVHDIFVNDYR